MAEKLSFKSAFVTGSCAHGGRPQLTRGSPRAICVPRVFGAGGPHCLARPLSARLPFLAYLNFCPMRRLRWRFKSPAAVDVEPLAQARDAANIPSPIAAETPVAPKPHSGKLATFYNALAGLEAGTDASPVTVLHLGDSHIASDRITGEVRKLMQARFGDAGRGLMMPGFPFPYYKAPGFDFEKIGEWTARE